MTENFEVCFTAGSLPSTIAMHTSAICVCLSSALITLFLPLPLATTLLFLGVLKQQLSFPLSSTVRTTNQYATSKDDNYNCL